MQTFGNKSTAAREAAEALPAISNQGEMFALFPCQTSNQARSFKLCTLRNFQPKSECRQDKHRLEAVYYGVATMRLLPLLLANNIRNT